MRVAYLGHFAAPHSTENEVAKALRARGHTVVPYQENTRGAFVQVAEQVAAYDVVVWTRTGWTPPVPHAEQRRMLARAKAAGVPSCAVHLDRWHGLARAREVAREPYFRCDVVCTPWDVPDWEKAGVNHYWLPPAVSTFECVPGTPRPEYLADVTFVGSWQPGYHAEWPHRPALIRFLRDNYGDRLKLWPAKGQPAVRGEALRDLYASTSVVVGDSCLVEPNGRGFSDRVPESLGRGAFLVHPRVGGVTDGGLWTEGRHLACWDVGDWGQLADTIDYYLAHGDERRTIAAAGREHTIARHTYGARIAEMERLIDRMKGR